MPSSSTRIGDYDTAAVIEAVPSSVHLSREENGAHSRRRRIFVFANPIAGRGRGREIASTLAERLRSAGFDATLCLDRADRFQGLGKERSVDAVVAIGGDGTLRSVAQWALSHLGDHTPPLLTVPMGTANLMGQHLGISWSSPDAIDAMVAAIRQRRIANLDAATANGELMLLVAGVGLDGSIVHQLDRLRSGPITKLSYVLPAVQALARYRFPPIRVKVDGKTIFKSQPGLAFVGNVREYGTGFPILPQAKTDDGLLDICVLPCSNHLDLPRLFLHALAGEHLGIEGVIYTKGRHVEVQSPADVPVQVDGESWGFTPLNVELLKRRIPFILPANDAQLA